MRLEAIPATTADGTASTRIEFDLPGGDYIEVRRAVPCPAAGHGCAAAAGAWLNPVRSAEVQVMPPGEADQPLWFLPALLPAPGPGYTVQDDAATGLPLSLEYAGGGGVRIEIRYSAYRLVDGVAIPFHIERYLNGTLNWDLRVESASAGAPPASVFDLVGGGQ
jgi:hypothetical protein